jgi:hypothetical protein
MCLWWKHAYCPQTASWSLRGVNVLSAVRGEFRACRWKQDFLLVSDKETYWFIAWLQTSGSSVLIISIVTALFICLGVNVFTLDSNAHYFRSRNRALPQDSHSLRGPTRDLWTVVTVQQKARALRIQGVICMRCMKRTHSEEVLWLFVSYILFPNLLERLQWEAIEIY